MVVFDEEKQNKKLGEFRAREEEQLANTLAQKYGVGYMDLSRISINTDALRIIPEEEARRLEVAPFNIFKKELSLGVRSPNKQEVKDYVAELEHKGYTVILHMVSRASLLRVWDMYKDLSYAVETKAGVIEISGDEIRKLMEGFKNLNDITNTIKEVLDLKKAHHVSRIVEIMIAGAVSIEASDVHLEPEAEHVRLRYRIDGVLTDVLKFKRDTYKLILSRIKLTSGLLLNIHDKAQDGRFSININDTEMEIRTSVLPDAYGESIVLRILNPNTISMPLEELGIEPKLFEFLMQEIHKPNGMLVTTGPTGSGKTTSLYAFLKKVHTSDIKIITIEDPIEYHLPGIVQTQTNKEAYTFSSGLRSALRQDPDVIMIGEIRDHEVASTAIQAALTGHFVFSTLHTNNAAGAIPRLIDLGVNPKIIGSAINVTMAQRLVRKLCEACKREIPIPENQRVIIEKVLTAVVDQEHANVQREKIWEAVGCEQCNNSGYKGRIGIFEAIIIDEEIEKLAAQNPSEREIVRASRNQGILSMREDGVLKALRGVTSYKELERVVALSEEVDQAELDRRMEGERV